MPWTISMVIRNLSNIDSEKYDFVVIGAGLYGAVMARELTDCGRKVLVLEKRDHIAGNCFTEEINGITVHKYGPHIFHTDNEEVWRYVNRFARFREFINSPAAVSGGRRYTLPFNLDTFTQLYGITDPAEAEQLIRSQAEEALKGKEPENLEEQAISMVGTGIYETLIKGYSEKQWGRECRDLPASIIKRIRISFDHSTNYFEDRYQGIPAEGYTYMIEEMLKGIKVITGCDYDAAGNCGKEDDISGRLIYTGPIDRYYSYCFGRLEYRSVRFEETRLAGSGDYQDRAVVNYTDISVPYTRVTEHRHFDPENAGKQDKLTIITKEYPESCNGINEPMYPVCDENNLRLYKKYRDLADADPKVHFGGRLGTFRYLDMDDVVASALADSRTLIEE